MKKYIKKILLLLAIVFPYFTYSSTVELKNLNGQTVMLEDFYKGKDKIIISFWATWCKPCIEELDVFSEYYEEWKEDYNTEIIAVSQDNSRSGSRLKSFVNNREWDFNILHDVNGNSKREFSFSTIPYLIILDKERNIIYKSNGYTYGSEKKIDELIKKQDE